MPTTPPPEFGGDRPTLPQIAGYEVVSELGMGGMGLVYLAKDQGLDRYVALKTFQSHSDHLSDLLAEEARIAGKLDHPAIVPVYEVNATAEPPYFAMAYVNGQDLSGHITRSVLNHRSAAELGVKIADALQHAHEQQVLHLDIKPANILLDSRGEPRITDFGLFALHGSEQSSEGAGTPQFMPPEQALGEVDNISAASDIYSLGAVLYACITGRPPLVSSNHQDLILKVVSRRPRTLRSFALGVPTSLDAVVMKCLEKDPAKRYASASELKDDLVRFLEGKPTLARPAGMLDNMIHFAQKHVFAASVSGSAVFLLLVITAFSILSLIRDNAALRSDLDKSLDQMVRYSHHYSSSLRRHGDDELLEVASQHARELREQGHPHMAAVWAAHAVIAAEEVDEDVPSDIEQILRDHFEEADVESRTALELAEQLHTQAKSATHVTDKKTP